MLPTMQCLCVVTASGHLPTSYELYISASMVQHSLQIRSSRFHRFDLYKPQIPTTSSFTQVGSHSQVNQPLNTTHEMQSQTTNNNQSAQPAKTGLMASRWAPSAERSDPKPASLISCPGTPPANTGLMASRWAHSPEPARPRFGCGVIRGCGGVPSTFSPHPPGWEPKSKTPHPPNWEPKSKTPHPPGWEPKSKTRHPPGWEPKSKTPHPPGWEPKSKTPHPPGWEPKTKTPHPPGWEPKTKTPYPPGWEPKTRDLVIAC